MGVVFSREKDNPALNCEEKHNIVMAIWGVEWSNEKVGLQTEVAWTSGMLIGLQ